VTATPDEEERLQAQIVLRSLRIPGDTQEELLVARSGWLSRYRADVVDRVLELLQR
jgi:hypothetical protein